MRRLVLGRNGGAFSSSEFGAMARDDGAPAPPACPQHTVPKQNPGNSRTACQRKATFGRVPVLNFPVARLVTGDWQMAGQWCGVPDPAIGLP